MHDHRPHPRTRPRLLRPGRSVLAALATALLASACAVGPDYVRPELPVQQRFVRATAAAPVPMPAADAGFWHRFDDPVLDRLVEEALLANHDLRIALARYDRANALLRGAGFDRFPTVTAQATASDSRASAGQMPGATRAERDVRSSEAGIVASWELDLFGRVRRGVEASRADLAAVQVAIVGEVANGYLGLRGLQERLRVARANADNQRETLRLVDARFDAGRGTAFDTSRARAQLETTLARLPALEAEIATTMHRLAVLTG